MAETQIVTCVNWTDFTGKKDTGISDVTESRLRCPDSFLGTTVIHTAEEETGSCGWLCSVDRANGAGCSQH